MFDAVLDNIKVYLGDLVNDRKRLLKILLIILILMIAVAFRIHKNQQSDITVNTNETETVSEDEVVATIYVDISGAVENPGVYEVDSGTRLYEVIEKAGGLTSDAYIDAINRAEFVEDGQKITIPVQADSDELDGSATSDLGSISSNGLININTAGKEELMNITGVGEVIAERIIEYRSSNKFKTPEDIMSVKGIGTATYEKMKDQITT